MIVSEIFGLAAQQAQWLTVRQTAVASNVANANTPGYRAVDVQPFADLLDNKLIAQTATHSAHFGGSSSAYAIKAAEVGGRAVDPNSSSVKIEEELVKSGDIAKAYQLNTAIVKSFHRMILMTAKG
ncbi:MAG: flagellar basal body rod protein FlgB [Rhizobiaceae bacterium]